MPQQPPWVNQQNRRKQLSLTVKPQADAITQIDDFSLAIIFTGDSLEEIFDNWQQRLKKFLK